MEYQTYKKRNSNIPIFTIILIVINILAFLYMEFTGDTESTEYLYLHGAMDVEAVLKYGEWYRVITHMFMHSGIDHLANNMIMLAAVGYSMENVYGRFKYIISYFICGICATVASAAFEIYTNDFAVGVGASGAIMGIFGIFIAMNVKYRRAYGNHNTTRLFVLIALMVFGNMQEGVDWMAHLGGAVSGLLLGFALYRPNNIGQRT